MFELLLPWLLRFGLVSARIGGVLVVSPMLGNKFFPGRVRLAVALILSLSLLGTPAVGGHPEIPIHLGLIVLLVIRELVIGAALGMVVRLIVATVTFAGSLVGVQMGLAVATIMDPQNGAAVGLAGRILSLAAIAILLALDAHHVVIEGLYQSFRAAPVGVLSLSDGVLAQVFSGGSGLFESAVKVASPAIVAVFLANIGMALLARTTPQLTVFSIGFVITISLGLAVLGGVVGRGDELFWDYREQIADGIFTLVRSL